MAAKDLVDGDYRVEAKGQRPCWKYDEPTEWRNEYR